MAASLLIRHSPSGRLSGISTAPTSVSEASQDRQLRLLTATVKFSEGTNSHMVDSSINQYISNQKQPVLLTYAVSVMKDAGFLIVSMRVLST